MFLPVLLGWPRIATPTSLVSAFGQLFSQKSDRRASFILYTSVNISHWLFYFVICIRIICKFFPKTCHFYAYHVTFHLERRWESFEGRACERILRFLLGVAPNNILCARREAPFTPVNTPSYTHKPFPPLAFTHPPTLLNLSTLDLAWCNYRSSEKGGVASRCTGLSTCLRLFLPINNPVAR